MKLFEPAKRMQQFTSAVFYELAAQKASRLQSGLDVIDLGIGSPDQLPDARIRQAFHEALDAPDAYSYARTEGTVAFRDAAVAFLANRYGVRLDGRHNVLSLIGAQDGLSHLTLATVNPGDVVLIPDPGYPIYEVSVHLAGGIPVRMPLRPENDFLPDFSLLDEDVLERTKLMILNFPSNPTTSVAPPSLFVEAVALAKQYGFVIVHDAAYLELVYDGYQGPSFLTTPGALDAGIELHSLSKTFHFAGPRVAFAAGRQDVLQALATVKSNIDYGIFHAAQAAGVEAMTHPEASIATMRALYQERRDAFVPALQAGGLAVTAPRATMFVWLPIPTAEDSREFSARLVRQSGVATVPGIGFGPTGEGYVRLALVQPADILIEAARRILHAIE